MQSLTQHPVMPATTLLDAATRYLALGWPVIPLSGKLPQVPWKEFQSRYPTENELTDWFENKTNPPTGLGIVTGNLSRLVVVDCDSRQDAEFWMNEHSGSPLLVATGGGGIHVYYALPRDCEVRNRQGLLSRRIDVRGEGGYITAPPSLHPSGERYRWQSFNATAKLPVFQPAWFQTAYQARRLPNSAETEQVKHALHYILKITAVAGKGGHRNTFRAACKLRDAGLSSDEALAILYVWNETNASPPWSAPELKHKIESAFAAKE